MFAKKLMISVAILVAASAGAACAQQGGFNGFQGGTYTAGDGGGTVTLQLNLSGYDPNSYVTVSWHSGDGDPITKQVQVNASGNFTGAWTIEEVPGTPSTDWMTATGFANSQISFDTQAGAWVPTTGAVRVPTDG